MGRQSDRHKYPAGKKRFEPLGVLIFAVAMIASFAQVSWAESDGRPSLIPDAGLHRVVPKSDWQARARGCRTFMDWDGVRGISCLHKRGQL